MAMTQKLLFFLGVDAQHSLAVGSPRGLRAGALEMRTNTAVRRVFIVLYMKNPLRPSAWC